MTAIICGNCGTGVDMGDGTAFESTFDWDLLMCGECASGEWEDEADDDGTFGLMPVNVSIKDTN